MANPNITKADNPNITKADKQLKFWKTINKTYKNNNKHGWCIADPKARKGATKITGIKYGDSKSWKLESKKNVYKFSNKIEWFKESKPNGSIVGTFNLIKAKKNQYLTNKFPTSTKGTILRIKWNGSVKDIYIKEMGFGNMNKSILPSANKKEITKGKIEFCSLAVFEEVQVKVFDGFYLRIVRDTNQKLPDIVKDAEKSKKNSFHFGIGYCKLRDNDEYLHSIIAISPEYVNQTSFQIIVDNANYCDLDIGIKQINHPSMFPLYNSNDDNGGDNIHYDNKSNDYYTISNNSSDKPFNEDIMSNTTGNTNSKNLVNRSDNIIDEDIDLQFLNNARNIQTGYENCEYNNMLSSFDTNTYNEFDNYSHTYIGSNRLDDLCASSVYQRTSIPPNIYSYNGNNNSINNNNNNINNDITSTQQPWKIKAKSIIDNINNNISFDYQRQIIQFLEQFQQKNINTWNYSNNNINTWNYNYNSTNYYNINEPLQPPIKRQRMLPKQH